MILLKTPQEIEKMTASGAILGDVLQKLLNKAAVGISTRELDEYADNLISQAGAKPSFKMEKNYHHATCMCVNDMVVHGVPNNYKLKDGDVLGIDAGVFYQGWHSDASWTVRIGGVKEDKIGRFLSVGQQALRLAIERCVPGNRVGDISKVIDEVVSQAGYSPVKQLVGHGIGRDLHEDPEIPCFLRGSVENTEIIKEGMVFAVEVIYNQGKSPVIYDNNDGWTIVTRDGSVSGLFEHTVAITASGPRILTKV
jgi:methionyl aminopeptidase